MPTLATVQLIEVVRVYYELLHGYGIHYVGVLSCFEVAQGGEKAVERFTNAGDVDGVLRFKCLERGNVVVEHDVLTQDINSISP